jgi:hypothetical protein
LSRRFVGWYTAVAHHTSCELRYVLVDVGRSIVFSVFNYFPFFPFNLISSS